MQTDENILLADDLRPFCDELCPILRENNWNVEVAYDGKKALEKLEETFYDIVLLDLQMPEMDGLDVLASLGRDRLNDSLYVIVLTGEVTVENAVESLRLGARDFIQKRVIVNEPNLFIERIKIGFRWQRERKLRERLEEEKRIAQEEAHLIARTVGHDIAGSYYAAMRLRLRSLSKVVQGNKLAEEGLKVMSDIAETIRGLGEELQSFGASFEISENEMRTIDINQLCARTVRTLGSVGKSIRICEEYSPEVLSILGSPAHLERVLLNLMANAARAMSNEGILTIETSSENDLVKIRISDTGMGIPEDRLRDIWRVGYTTKERGTGLGLPLCKKTIERHEGEIYVESKQGQGTTFTILIPKTEHCNSWESKV